MDQDATVPQVNDAELETGLIRALSVVGQIGKLRVLDIVIPTISLGDVIQPTDGILGVGSGGNYAVAAARALVAHSQLDAAEIVRQSLEIAAGIDVYTNTNITVESMEASEQ